MASKLNKNRIFYTKLGLLATLILSAISRPLGGQDHLIHEFFDMLGGILIWACAIGRLYATAFLGGHKNQSLITYGPFSTTRNPLYFFSFLGVCGMVLMSNHFILMLLIPALFLAVYVPLVTREEAFLREHFGAPYEAYCAATPRFLPRLSLYTAPDSVEMQPRFMRNALKDSLMWFAMLPLFELFEILQHTGMVQPLLTLP